MKGDNRYMMEMLDMDLQESKDDLLRLAGIPIEASVAGNTIVLTVPFHAYKINKFFEACEDVPSILHEVTIRAYRGGIVRVTFDHAGDLPLDDKNVMLQMAEDMETLPLHVDTHSEVWKITDGNGNKVMDIYTTLPPITPWGKNKPQKVAPCFDATVYVQGSAVEFMAHDTFTFGRFASNSLGYMERAGLPHRCMYSVRAAADAKFCGTGERFSKMDLSGRTLFMENRDGMGVNNRRAYKNVPFYLSSEGYGLLILSSAHIRLSLADVSTCAAQGLIEDNNVDLFFIGGENPERIVYQYRRLTGFPADVPLWSYGMWMSRMSYFSAEETFQIANRLRAEQYPCDVLHLDTGWFEKDWQCEWRFSKEKFPNPAEYIRKMRRNGFRITLWQLPSIGKDTIHYETAKKNGYLAPKEDRGESDFGEVDWAGNIDFSNPAATKWYQDLLRPLLEMGVAAIKTDFGEEIDEYGSYHSIPYHRLHNLYAVLYQKAAYEVTKQITGEGIIWARAGWTGAQRYPLHWGGDAAGTFAGMAGSLKGGLHLGISGFGFWSHDVPGFFSLPDSMSTKPDDDIYVRWTQFGVFSSHLRYHGTHPREPYEFPNVCDIVREWLKLRYALIPYIAQQGTKLLETGFPMLCPLLMRHNEEKICWHIDDEYYFGEEFLVAPILSREGVRDVYLPVGKWVNFWTGECLDGGREIKNINSDLAHMPIFVKFGASLPVYPEYVSCTDEMDMQKTLQICFDENYTGFKNSLLGQYIHL